MSKGGDHSVALCDSYPVNAVLELTLVTDEVVSGLVYCTDELSRSIVLRKSLNYTTLASEIRVINASSVKKKKVILAQAPAHKGENAEVDEVALPLLSVSKKAIDEREKRAITLAQESFQHINQQASPEGQKVFDRLLKACNEVKWKGESIIVLNQINVDPPYKPENCKLLQSSDVVLDEGSLERVKRIVASGSA
jgi:hypothetical protein